MAREIFAVGFQHALHPEVPVTFVPHYEGASLDDADVILFALPQAPYAYEAFQGKPALRDEDSFRYVDMLAHWRRELANAIRDGKTVFVQLIEPRPVFVETGSETHSGTGRSRVTTRGVSLTDQYKALPFHLNSLTGGHGSAIKLHPSASILATDWNEFGPLSSYEVRFDPAADWTPLLLTSGRRCVGAMNGRMLVLPPVLLVDQEEDRAGDENEEEEGEDDEEEEEGPTWSEAERVRSYRFIQELLAIDAQLSGDVTLPAPDWMSADEFLSPSISTVSSEIASLDEERRRLDDQRSDLLDRLKEHKQLQLLLFGKGPALERAVRRALRIMGFDAQPYRDAESEFDAIIRDGDVRLIGEFEGRDNSAINIDKMSQLERNVAEDFAREEIESYARGVLFGNPQRLTHPASRKEDFTVKCRTSAERNRFSLVLTADMFLPVTYLEETNDSTYAAQCRETVVSTEGAVVRFPDVPSAVVTRSEDGSPANGSSARTEAVPPKGANL